MGIAKNMYIDKHVIKGNSNLFSILLHVISYLKYVYM